MEDPHEILTLYDIPRCVAAGISPIPKENIVPVLEQDIDKIRLEEVGELEMSLEETKVNKYDPYSPPIPVRPLQRKKLKLITPHHCLPNVKHVSNIRGPLDSTTPSPSNKPWRPFLLKNPQTSPVPPNVFSPSASANVVNKHDIKYKKPSFSGIFNKYNNAAENVNELEIKLDTSKYNLHIKNNEHRSAEHETNSDTNKHNSNIQKTFKITEELKLKKCIDNRPNDKVKENSINSSLNNHNMEDPFISEIEREINKFHSVLSGSEISSPIKILSKSAGQVIMGKVTPNKNLGFDKAKDTSNWVQQSNNVLLTCNRDIGNKSAESNSFVSGNKNSENFEDSDSDFEIFLPKKKIKIEINHTDSSNDNKNIVNKENNP